MKPSLHELIKNAIYNYESDEVYGWIDITEADELAEQIIKIVRDYHLVEPKDILNQPTGSLNQYEPDKEEKRK